MSMNSRALRQLIGGALVLATICFLASSAPADCSRDAKGEVYCGGGRCLHDSSGKVWCARPYRGDAMKTRDGKVLCGKGRCAKDSKGRIFCSSETDGAVLKDSQGRIRCYGRCEPASAALCESTRAGSSARSKPAGDATP